MFKYSCYIEYSEEALQHLEAIGYKLIYPTHKREAYIQTQGGNAFITDGIYRCGDEINCLGNLPLFKALTAVRDDSDYMQQFTDGVNWDLCIRHNHREWITLYKPKVLNIPSLHKATKEELIEKFKKY